MFDICLALSQLAINILEDLAKDIAKLVKEVDGAFRNSIVDNFIYKQLSGGKQTGSKKSFFTNNLRYNHSVTDTTI